MSRLPSKFLPLFALLALLPLGGCDPAPGGGDGPKGEAAALQPLPGKADATEQVRRLDPLALAEPRAGRFERDLQLDGYPLRLAEGARVQLEVTQRGSSRGLDTVLYLFGPQGLEGGFGDTARAFDDDSGWGRLSRLRTDALPAGEYLVVVGTYSGRGRGNYRLLAACLAGDCAPPPAPPARCHPALVAAAQACLADLEADQDFDPAAWPLLDRVLACTDVEPLAEPRDGICGPEAPATPAAGRPAFCALDLEAFAGEYLPGCTAAVLDLALDRTCPLGAHVQDLDRPSDPLVSRGRRRLSAADIPSLSPLEAAQILRAVITTAYDDVVDLEGAFAAVDEGEIHQLQLVDASRDEARVAYRLWAGDNAFGAVFAADSAEPLALIQDGDLAACLGGWGPQRRPCHQDTDCAAGLRCVGARADSPAPSGACQDLGARHPQEGAPCADDAACPAPLICAGAALGGEGLCGPAWHRRAFFSAPEAVIPDGSGVLEQTLHVSGLTSVSTDVRVHLWVSHPQVSELAVTLENPSGTEAILLEGDAEGGEIYWTGRAVRGFPGDESVNGPWILRIRDRQRGNAGQLMRFGLELTSRWD